MTGQQGRHDAEAALQGAQEQLSVQAASITGSQQRPASQVTVAAAAASPEVPAVSPVG